jgi:hypothetical protein
LYDGNVDGLYAVGCDPALAEDVVQETTQASAKGDALLAEVGHRAWHDPWSGVVEQARALLEHGKRPRVPELARPRCGRARPGRRAVPSAILEA